MDIRGEVVLVTGGAGYIGSHAVLALLDAGARPVVLDDLSTGFVEAVPAGVPLVVTRTHDRAVVLETLRAYRARSVLHFAGSVVVPESVADPLGYYGNNVQGSLSLLSACVEAGVSRFVFSSTAAVYGEPRAVPVTEAAPAIPLSPYGASKRMVEQILADTTAAHDMGVAVLRYFNVAGADPAGRAGQRCRRATHLFKAACEAAVGKRASLSIFGTDYPTADGTCVRDYIHVSDLAAAHVEVLKQLPDRGPPLVLNCGYGHGHSVREVIEAVEREAGRPLQVRVEGRRAGDPAAIVADSAALRASIGWVPRHDDLGHIARTALAWERSLE